MWNERESKIVEAICDGFFLHDDYVSEKKSFLKVTFYIEIGFWEGDNGSWINFECGIDCLWMKRNCKEQYGFVAECKFLVQHFMSLNDFFFTDLNIR